MIRLAKKVQILEWGEGTNTLNQVWSPIGTGKISRHVMKDGIATVTISLDSPIQRKTDNPNALLKLAQQGEGMAGGSDRWGEVASAILKSVQDGGRAVTVEIQGATKFDTRRNVGAGT
jgi:hypothetical protein